MYSLKGIHKSIVNEREVALKIKKANMFFSLNGDHGSTTQSQFQGPMEKIKHFKKQDKYLF